MNTLSEPPLVVAVGGVLFSLVIGWIGLKTRRRALLILAAVTLLLSLAAIVVEQIIISDEESLQRTLQNCIATLEANDLEGVLGFVALDAKNLRTMIKTSMARLDIERVVLKRVHRIEVRDVNPKTAVLEFNVVGVGRDKQGRWGSRRYPRFCTVTFVQAGQTWTIRDFRDEDALTGFRQR
ncbi:MAG: hypothetical protein MK165_18890 [Pirellulaceae bacterium]|nr:hypothetical protein [Pirellulaceae bacterium]